jgi:ubiquinol-cytochrome c reductase cytochrome b subunit
MLRRAGRWLHDRLGLGPVIDFVARHPVPPGTTGRRGWMYVLGAATLTAFLLQFATGIALATLYVPSPAHAYESLLHINQEVWYGWFVRGMHYFGASAMMVLIALHMARVFLTGSYKFPREGTWLFGLVLLLLTVLMAATGQLLRWDNDGLWTVSVGAQLLARVPLIGEWLARFVLAGETVGGQTLGRFFALHVVVLPVLLFATVGVHLWLVLHHGISEPPKAGRRVDPQTYRAWYRRHTEAGGRRYWPDAAWQEIAAALVVVVTVMGLAWWFGPRGPDAPPDPAMVPADPRPDWYFRWYYALLWVKPRGLETLVMVYLPLGMAAVLVLLPFVRGRKGERSPARRPWAVAAVAVTAAVIGYLTYLGMRAPWAMDFGTRPLTAAEAGAAEGPVWEGARLFHERGCQFCHAVQGRGGAFGPELTQVLRRLPPEVVVARTLNGIGDMPAYRGVLADDEMAAILAFLRVQDAR